MLMTTSAEWTPSDNAWRQAASTAGNRSVSTAARILAIPLSPSSDAASLRLNRSCLNTPDRLVGPLGMAVRLGPDDAFAGCGFKRGWLVGL
jgi:hypothetical protein